MANKAHVILRGTVMQEPKTAQTSTGQTWLKINLAVQTTKKDPAPKNPKFPYMSDYYNVNVYGKYAETLLPSIRNQTRLVVIGDMYMGEPYTSKSTGKVTVVPVVTASTVEVIGQGSTNTNYTPRQQPAAPTAPAVESYEDEEAPF